MAKLKHAADGSLHLLQPAMQLMAALMTKALGVWRGVGGCAQCVGVRDNRVLMAYCGIFPLLLLLLLHLLLVPRRSNLLCL